MFFYEQPDPASLSQKMLRAHGAILPDVGAKKGDFDDFYKKAFEDIAARIRSNGTLAACDEGNVYLEKSPLFRYNNIDLVCA